ncbi:hypothetical protein [Reichenbachiella sp.]|uniref:hypothetical protein n=1 Tax=Reichenbachiella sp. TaxID=2184521 RepID=UPI003B5C4B59
MEPQEKHLRTTQKKNKSALVKEIYENLEKWKASREHYLDYDKKHPEEIVIEDPHASQTLTSQPEVPAGKSPDSRRRTNCPNIDRANREKEELKEPKEVTPEENTKVDEVEKLKNQVAEEIEAEEESISKALSEITEKGKKQKGHNI